MIIAHLSDLHLFALAELTARRLLNKRFTGWVNIKLRRGIAHQRWAVEAVASEVRKLDVDHVVITGDVTGLALEREFEQVQSFLRQDLAMSADRVSMVPGNHDTYTRGAYRDRRFEGHFGEHITSDLPGASGVPGLDRYPFVRLRGPVAIIGLSTALPRPPLVASGHLGKPQRMALHSLLAHDQVRRRTPVILQHHPWHNPASRAKTALEGLTDAADELLVLDQLDRGLLLHGHLHKRVHRRLTTSRGHLEAIGSTSASLVDTNPAKMAGFNLYEIDAAGAVGQIDSFVLDPSSGKVTPTPLPKS
ncbi:MAG: metallophosphoesterase [Deltaproteobacteria bacterium]|nr:MAG: metallophosphoesterase [Deltaproteobacteria bacterium]